MEYGYCHYDGKKYFGSSDNGGFNPCGMGQADIKENILAYRLYQGKFADHKQVLFCRPQPFSLKQASEQNHQDTRQGKPHSGEYDL